jgi:hypothetical protein
LRIKILTEEGRKHANVELVFSKGYEEISNLRARTIKPDGSIVDFDGNVFEKTILKSREWAYLAKTFTLPDVRKRAVSSGVGIGADSSGFVTTTTLLR